MLNCNICGRNIIKGKRIASNGIKYICLSEEDVKLCNEYQEIQYQIQLEKRKKMQKEEIKCYE